MGERISLAEGPTVVAPAPGEVGYTPPVDLVPLPSKGRVYPDTSPFHLAESVEIRSMTAADEDILTSAALLKQGKAISVLLKSCLMNKLVEPDDLVVGDRNAILIALRISGYGPEYTVPVTCPACGNETKGHSFDLSKLEVKPLGADPIRVGENAFNFKLPVSNKEVVFKLFTAHDDREVDQLVERTRKAAANAGVSATVDNTMTTRLLHSIISLGGETDRAKLATIVRRLPARDSRALRTKMEDVVPGVRMEQVFTCGNCGEESEVDVPMGPEFFWPSR